MNRAPFQELYKHNQADFPNVLRPVVKRSFQPTRVDMLPLALRQAFDTMVTGRPGPVNLDIPYNVYQEEADVAVPPASHMLGTHRPAASSADIAAVMKLLKQAQRPVFFIGHGATLSEAGPELTALSQRLGVPVITSPNGMGCVPADDVMTLGLHRPQRCVSGKSGGPARGSCHHGRHAIRRSLVVELACPAIRGISRRPSWCTSTSIPQELGRNYPADVGIVADCKTFCAQLLAAVDATAEVNAARFAGWREQVVGWQTEWEAFVRPNFSADTSPLRPEFVVGALAESAARRRDPVRLIPACTITGSCSSGSRGGRRACSTAGATRRWASACAVSWARSLPHRIARALR